MICRGGTVGTCPLVVRPICRCERVEATKGSPCRLQHALYPRRVCGARKIDLKLLHQHLPPTRKASKQRRTAQPVGTIISNISTRLGQLFVEYALPTTRCCTSSVHDPLSRCYHTRYGCISTRVRVAPTSNLSVARRKLYVTTFVSFTMASSRMSLQVDGTLAKIAGVSRSGDAWHDSPGRRPWTRASGRHGLAVPDSRSPAAVYSARYLMRHFRSC